MVIDIYEFRFFMLGNGLQIWHAAIHLQ